ncbi:MAG: phosphoribosyl-AMP cyclohydrolase [Chloroflexota bacterium]|nr:phosphoribosyl-AMP cyclohydrolase [Chloroflexota bacterium]
MTELPRRAIATDRLVLEPVTVGRAPELHMAIEQSRAHIARWLSWAPRQTFNDTLAFTARMVGAWADGSEYSFLVTTEGRVCGDISIRPKFAFEGNIGYWLGEDVAGRGYMTEACEAVAHFGHRALGLQRVELRAHVDNRASQRVAEKCGMRREGLVRGGVPLEGGGGADAFIYGRLVDDPWRDTGTGAGTRPDGAPPVAAPDFSRGLVTAVVQDVQDGAVLMVAHMSAEAYDRTLQTGHGWFWSRSRERLWEKGETSGNILEVRSVTLDCDGDAVLLGVVPAGPACHTGARTCFHNPVEVVKGQPGRAKRGR